MRSCVTCGSVSICHAFVPPVDNPPLRNVGPTLKLDPRLYRQENKKELVRLACNCNGYKGGRAKV